jgi:cytochrome c556
MKLRLMVTAAILGTAGIACAQESGAALTPDQIIAARQTAYDLMYGTTIGIKAAIATKADVKDFEDAANAIARWGQVAPTMFPDGTQQGHDTKAKPDIWSDRAGFVKDANNLTEQATKLAQLAKAGDKDGFADQFRAVGKACKTCHDTFKAK